MTNVIQPNICSLDEDGVLALEWWHEDRKLTLYAPLPIVLRVSGYQRTLKVADASDVPLVESLEWLRGER